MNVICCISKEPILISKVRHTKNISIINIFSSVPQSPVNKYRYQIRAEFIISKFKIPNALYTLNNCI